MMSKENDSTEAPPERRPQRPASRSIFNVPTPIKQLFDRFPLVTYSTNDLPQRAPRQRNSPVLHIFTTNEGAVKGSPSYNPACLKWQVRKNAKSTPFSPAHISSRRTSSFPISISASLPRVIMRHQAARCHSFSLPNLTPPNMYSQYHQTSCSDGQ